MQAYVSKLFKTVTGQILALTLHDTMRSSHDFEDVRAALNDRTDWSIELFRSCFTIHFTNGGYFCMQSALCFLIMAESIRIYYGRLSPAELKEQAESIGYATFAVLFAVLDIGFVVVRVAGLIALSGSPALATSLILVSVSPSILLPLLIYAARFLGQRGRESGREVEMESGNADDGAGI